MRSNPIAAASRAKGPLAMLKRGRNLSLRYGTSPAKMEQMLRLFAQILSQFDCGATFPLPAATLQRNPGLIADYARQNIEFAIHGHTHIDYAELDSDAMLVHLLRAREIFAQVGITAVGFRAPYLSRTPSLYAALEETEFLYASNQPIVWDSLTACEIAPSTRGGYERALSLYAPWPAAQKPSLPRFIGNVLEIPVSLPDDEMLLDRLGGEGSNLVARVWKRILLETYQLGEIFTVQLHPERIELCAGALSDILAKANTLDPRVWIVRLDELATWWRDRAATSIKMREIESGTWELSAAGPPGTTVLLRGVEALTPSQPWADGYRQAMSATCAVRAECRPIIGLSPDCPPAFRAFLRQQGYICEVGPKHDPYAIYIDEPDLGPKDERSVLTMIEKSSAPLVRLGRWPNGARSALCITGDLDALTIWDYVLRAFGK